MAKTCIDIPAYKRGNGELVHAHKRCYNLKPKTEQDITRVQGLKDKLKGALAPTTDPQEPEEGLAVGQEVASEESLQTQFDTIEKEIAELELALALARDEDGNIFPAPADTLDKLITKQEEIYQKMKGLEPFTKNNAWAIKSYTDTDFIAINEGLNDSDNMGDSVEAVLLAHKITQLDIALEKLPPHEGLVYRVSPNTNDRHKWYEANIGTKFSWKGYTSATMSEDVTKFWDLGGAQKIKFRINSKTGRSIAHYSEFRNEQEVLMPRDIEYIIKSVTLFQEEYLIDLDEIKKI